MCCTAIHKCSFSEGKMGKKQFETLSNHPNHQSAILTQPISPDTNRSRFISTFDWKYLTGHSDLITFILCDMTWKTKRSVWLWESLGGRWAERETDAAQDCAELSQRTNLQDLYMTSTIYGFARNYKTQHPDIFSVYSLQWGWIGGGEHPWRSPWTSSRWYSPYPHWLPVTGVTATEKLSNPSAPGRWQGNKHTALGTTARTSMTAGWYSMSGRPVRISLFWGSSTPEFGFPVSRMSTLLVRIWL